MWFNPREGGDLQTGSVQEVTVKQKERVDLGTPPNQLDQDWLAVVRANDSSGE